MAYQREQREPVKWVQIGAIWNSEKDGQWCGKGQPSQDLVSWKLKLMLLDGVKIDIFPIKDKQNERVPDFNIFLRVPESILPDEYWDELEDRQAQYANRGSGRDRNGYDRQDRGPAPAPRREAPQSRAQSQGRPAPRDSDPYPPRRQESSRPAPRERTPEVPDQNGDLVDPFEEENSKDRRYSEEPAKSSGRGSRRTPQADDDF